MLQNLAIALVSSSAAAFTPGTPSTDPALLSSELPFTASVSFVSSNAGATGMLYFIGSINEGPITPPSAPDDPDLGVALFPNHNAPPAASGGIELGAFGAGATIHFAYLVTNGAGGAPTGSLFRTDTDLDPAHFTLINDPIVDAGATTFRVGVEDIRNPARSDWDYNDLIFDVTLTPVPTPGAGLLALCGGGLAMRRRRK